MQIKLLNEIVGSIAGRQASEVVNILLGKKNVNEFIIAKKLKLTINQTRNILYKLSDAGLVSFTRKKDKKKGWYTYFWTLNTEKSLELLEKRVTAEIDNLKSHLKNRESKRYYVCPVCKVEIGEENALLHNFTCSECGSVYELQTDKKIIADLNSGINKLNLAMMSIKEELGKIRVKDGKRKDRIEKKEVKEKEKIRKKKLNERRRLKKKLNKGKKPEKKKAKKKKI